MYRCIVGNRSLGLSTVYRLHLLEAMLLYVALSVCVCHLQGTCTQLAIG